MSVRERVMKPDSQEIVCVLQGGERRKGCTVVEWVKWPPAALTSNTDTGLSLYF